MTDSKQLLLQAGKPRSHSWNKSDISYLKTSRAFDVLIHSGKPNSVS